MSKEISNSEVAESAEIKEAQKSSDVAEIRESKISAIEDDIDCDEQKEKRDYEKSNELNDNEENIRKEIKEQSPYSDEINKYISSVDELNVYKNADLYEETYGEPPKTALVRDDIDMNQTVDHKGRTNSERIELGLSPLTKDGEVVELHHIGQHDDSPYAELTTSEHRGVGNDAILHDKKKEAEIDRNEFSKEKHVYWSDRGSFIEACEEGEFD